MVRFSWREGVLAVASTLIAILAFDFALGVVRRSSLGIRSAILEAFHEVPDERHYTFVPGYGGRFWATDVEINRLGFRGLEPDPTRAAVAVVGDSIAFGLGVALHSTFAWRLEEMLAASGIEARVLNLGVPAYDTLQETTALERNWSAIAPRVVVVQFDLNDAEVDSEILGRLHEYPGGAHFRWSSLAELFDRLRLEPRLEALHRRANDVAVFRSRYAGLIDSVDGDAEIEALTQAVHLEIPAGDLPAQYFGDRERVGRIRHAFARLRELALVHETPVIVLLVPHLEQVGSVYPYRAAHAVAAHEALRAGFRVVDATGSFMGRGMQSLRAHPGDHVHPGVQGNEILAQELLEPVSSALRRR
jgi:lysophospholipase L1-like esterase